MEKCKLLWVIEEEGDSEILEWENKEKRWKMGAAAEGLLNGPLKTPARGVLLPHWTANGNEGAWEYTYIYMYVCIYMYLCTYM